MNKFMFPLLQTSVLCKSAVHAGVASDSLGGRVAVNRGRSLTLYEPTFANGILSKMYVRGYCIQKFIIRDHVNVKMTVVELEMSLNLILCCDMMRIKH